MGYYLLWDKVKLIGHRYFTLVHTVEAIPSDFTLTTSIYRDINGIEIVEAWLPINYI